LSHAKLLEAMTIAIEAAKKSPTETVRVLKQLAKDKVEDDHTVILAILHCGAAIKWVESGIRQETLLRSASTALAAERFRLRFVRWPESLDDLIRAGLLREAPQDPLSSKALRFRRAEDGVVIFSAGPEGAYDGTARDDRRKQEPATPYIEFRLWDVGQRRQLAFVREPTKVVR
jgi:hypothetical protein